MGGQLNVYLRNEKVGKLWLDDSRRFTFQYDAEWLTGGSAVPLSLRLPLQEIPYEDDQARPFFANLLPESDLRRMIARKLGLSEGNDFALLEAVGGECAGAVSLLPDDTQPTGKVSYLPLDDDEFNRLIVDLPKRPMLAGEEGIRLSLAGAQNKLPVFFDGQKISLPLDAAPSSHILKPPVAQHPDTVENEYFCMRIAEKVGLSVPTVSILNKQQPLYLIERYDRKRIANDGLERVHQEDFCQAMGIPPENKYEKEGGPTLQQCFALVREHSVVPVADVKALLNWVVFNYLIGNADAHGKNVSLLLSAQGPILAPFYDLMSTAVYPELATQLAMKIGGEARPQWIIARRWEKFADEIEVNFKMVRKTLLFMKEAVFDNAKELAEAFHTEQGECEVIDKIVAIIEERRKKLTNIFELETK